ncbi:MAG: 3-deoxy-8-phosphooctulonate synthase, partial [bacterium]
TFGYHNLVIDFRSIPIMKGFGFPVSIDATHSLQHPGSARGYSGGNNEFIEYVAMAGLVFGADVVFLETHPQPQTAPSDAAVMLPLSRLEPLLVKLKKIQKQVKNNYKGGC